jgi:hypothetical protein
MMKRNRVAVAVATAWARILARRSGRVLVESIKRIKIAPHASTWIMIDREGGP